MKLTSFHLNGSRVFLAPIGPGLNVVHCPTGDRAATISDSLRAVLFGAVTNTGWPTPDGEIIGSVDVTDEAGSGRVMRRRVGYESGPLEVSLHDGRSHSLSGQIQQLSAATGELQIVDFGNGKELSEVAIRACHSHLEAQPDWRDGQTDYQWESERTRLLHRERELVEIRHELVRQRDSQQPGYAFSSSACASSGMARLQQLRQRQSELRSKLERVSQPVAPTPGHGQLETRLSAIEAQVQHIERLIDDMDSHLMELQRKLPQRDPHDADTFERLLLELREVTGALERQLSWFDHDRRLNREPALDADPRERESIELRRIVLDLLDSISRQEQSLTSDNLKLEAKQLQRCRGNLREHLRRLLEHRQPAASQEHSLHGDDRTPTWSETRRPLQQELDVVEHELHVLEQNPAQPRWSVASSEQLAATDRELADVRLQLEKPRPQSPRHQPATLSRASQLLSRVSEGELVTLRYDAPASTLFVVDYEGKPHASYDLPLDVQRLVALSLLLSIADRRFPIVLDRVFEETPETATASILEVLRDACRDGIQVLAIVYDRHAADRLQKMQVELRYADWAAPNYRETRSSGPSSDARTIYQHPAAFSQSATTHYGQPHRWRPASTTAPAQTQVWDAHNFTGAPGDGHTSDQSSRIFEDSHRPTVQAEAHSHRHHLDYADSVSRIPYFGRDIADRLEQYGYWTAADFIRGDATEISEQLRGEIETQEIRTWQAQCQMMCGVARLRAFDAKILVACGISDPLQLQETEPGQLVRRVQAFVETRAGRRLVRSGTPFEISRIQRWIASPRTTVASGDGRTGRYARRVDTTNGSSRDTARQTRSRSERRDVDERYEFDDRQEFEERSDHDTSRTDYDRGEGTRSAYASDDRRQRREPRPYAENTARRGGRSARLMPNADDAPMTNSVYSSGASVTTSSGKTSSNITAATNGQVMKFYLDMNSDVEAAPTIGPKTAELLYEVGIHTVGHLLEATPAEVADQLDHQRISANNVLEWQLQSALVCRIPELRGHDAQILVAIGVTEPEQLASYEAQDLYAMVAPFVDTKAGQRIVRGGKSPDLNEVTEWISFAKHARQLKAA